ncbi:MAG: homoserine dehydrogenase [Anaerolineae bacterium]|nr:homoserine dehydrogenase [Anaerolineae bacterium]
MSEPREIPYLLIGLGNIGHNLLDVYTHREAQIARDYGLRFVLVGAADSQGAAIDANGLDPVRVRALKLAGQSVSRYPMLGRPGMTGLEMILSTKAELFVDASPTNLQDGEPGLSCVRTALGSGLHVVMANKGPLVLAFDALSDLARRTGTCLLYSGTVAGGLPTVNIGVRDLAGSGVERIEGIFNGTTNYILTRMEEEQISYQEALKGAQEAGIAEPDPSLDVDGWDAANKLVIIANSVLRRPTTLEHVRVEGIRRTTLEDLQSARARGQVLKLLALAEREGDDFSLSVQVTALDQSHPLARIGRWDMGVVYHTDFMGIISAVIEEKGPVPTSAAVLRDMINIYAAQ